MQKFPELNNDQVAILRAQFSTGHVLDDNCALALNDEQHVYTVFEDIDLAMAYAKSVVQTNKDLELIIYGKQKEALKYIAPG